MKKMMVRKPLLQFVMLSLLSVVSVLVMSGESFAALDCTACHGTAPGTDMRPLDGATRDPNTGAFVGNHVKHMPAVVANNPLATACNPCHANATYTTSYTSGHRDGKIQFAAVGYSKGAFTNQTSVPSANTGCSTASCHANPYGTGYVPTPVWGSTAANCTACHSANPIVAINGPGTGTHTTHGSVGAVCTDCHAAGTSATTMPNTGHIDGTITVTGGYPATAKHAAGSYAVNAKCSTATCHADVYSTGSALTPAWGTTGNGCNSCHTIPIAATGPATGSHVRHNVTNCALCHTGATNNTTKPTANHINGNIDVADGYPVTTKHASGTYTGSCSAASCHANPYGAGYVTTPVWGVMAANCVACHNAYPITASGPATGNHVKHMTTTSGVSVSCASCHTAGTTATTMPGTLHANGNIDITIGGYPATVAPHAANSGYATCSNLACHSQGKFTPAVVTWGATLNCNGCHGYPPASSYHNAGMVGQCNSCHSDVNPGGTGLAADTTFKIPAQHMDGIVQGGKCDACHGYPPVLLMTGNGTNLSYSSAKVQNYAGGGGVHDVAGHLPKGLKASQGLGFTPCLVCHPNATHNQGFGNFSTNKVQVVVDPKFKFNTAQAVVYTANARPTANATGTCTNVSCHFQASPKWATDK